jgi:hypothetical protein
MGRADGPDHLGDDAGEHGRDGQAGAEGEVEYRVGLGDERPWSRSNPRGALEA